MIFIQRFKNIFPTSAHFFCAGFTALFASVYLLDAVRWQRNALYLLLLVWLCSTGIQSIRTLPSHGRMVQGIWYALLGFVGLSFLSMSWDSDVNQEAVWDVGRRSILALLFVSCVASFATQRVWKEWRAIEWLLAAMALAGVLAACIGMWDYYASNQQRLIGIGLQAQPVRTGVMLAIAIIAASTTRALPLWLRGLCLLPLIYALYLTQCRSAMAGLAVAFGVACFCWQPRRTIACGALVITALLIACIGFDVSVDMFGRGLSAREEIWQQVWHKVQAHPWLGYGMTSEHPFTHRYSPLEGSHSHNMYLSQWLYLGLGGMLLFLGIIGAALWHGYHAYKIHIAPLLWLVLACIIALVDFGPLFIGFGVAWMLFWLPLGLVISLPTTSHHSE